MHGNSEIPLLCFERGHVPIPEDFGKVAKSPPFRPGWNLPRPRLRLITKQQESATLAVEPHCLSGFGQISRSRGAVALGRALLSGCDRPRLSPLRSLAV